ncbi:hypothetical protein [Aeromonas phage 25AhydR2PP]|uniref:Uncharacterized protein n=1 Tax=Aeromonas phage 25AhydR2PP TaxID=2163976 RepID=A0A2S1PFP6_9CAUD|nr:hypothetical protein HOT20_gp46 [Aeromonas phage 25AhydR2PP]AWH15388.1 hypothetical protein [Aeromonas phage 25AhydR2PP]
MKVIPNLNEVELVAAEPVSTGRAVCPQCVFHYPTHDGFVGNCMTSSFECVNGGIGNLIWKEKANAEA